MNDIILFSLLLMAVVFAGSGVIHIWGRKLIKHLGLLLAFGGAYLIGLIFLHLVPEVFSADLGEAAHNHAHHDHDHGDHSHGAYVNPGWFILLGFVLQIFLEYFSNGIEHGHQHKHGAQHSHDHSSDEHHHHHHGEADSEANALTRGFPLAAFISLCVHAFVEAMPLAGGAHHHHHHGHLSIELESSPLLVGLMIHTFPVAMVLAGLLLATKLSKAKQWMYISIFAVMPVFGMLLADSLLHMESIDSNFLIMALSGMLIGILMHIATTMLFETSDGHHFNLRKLLIIVTGLGLAALTLA